MRSSRFCMLFPGIVGILGDAGTDWMFSLRTCGWNHVARDNQPFFPEVPYRRNRDVCISGIGRRSWLDSRPCSRGESCRSRRRRLEKRTVGSNDISYLHDPGPRLPLSILPEEKLTGIAYNSSQKRRRFSTTLRPENRPTRPAEKQLFLIRHRAGSAEPEGILRHSDTQEPMRAKWQTRPSPGKLPGAELAGRTAVITGKFR